MKYSLARAPKAALSAAAVTLFAATLLLGQTVSNDAAFHRVSERLKCQCSCPYLVSSCNMVDCSSATYIRKTIQTSLAAGKSEDQIVADFVTQYGERILAEPPKSGFWLSAWVTPFFVLVVGGFFVAYILLQWKARHVPATATAPASPGGDTPANSSLDRYRKQIDRELERD